MKFGLFVQLGVPRPINGDDWNPGDEKKVFDNGIEQIVWADKLGFDYVFVTEHHFLEEYAHTGAPEVVLSYVAGKTSKIRLGHGIIQMIPNMNPPARIAERIATLDVLSGGRVEFGTGEGTSDIELDAFHTPRALKKAMWEDTTRETCKMLSMSPYPGFNGEFFSFPERNIVPKPLQKPHPPLWIAASRRETTMMGARFGMGSMGFGFEEAEETAERVNEYYRIIREECMPIGQAINPALLVNAQMMCAPTDDEAITRSANGPAFFAYALGYYSTSPGTKRDAEGRALIEAHQPGRTNIWRNFMNLPENQKDGRAQLEAAELIPASTSGAPNREAEMALALGRAARSRAAVGSPDTIRENLRRYEDAHCDVMNFNLQPADRKHEHVMESLELFAKQVMPEFQERHETTHKKWRAQQLYGVDFPINSSI